MSICYTGTMPEKEIFQAFGETMTKLIQEDPRVVYLDADLMGALKTQGLWDKFPQNVFNVGIQEANMVGMACGMYLNGCIPYIHSFAPFATRRVYDQLFVSGAYAKKSIRVIGSDAGIMATHNGGTHMSFEDVALMRVIPGACVVDITDSTMMSAMLRLTKSYGGITYLRTPRRGVPDIYSCDERFELGRGKILREGNDVTLIACGIMVATCLQAAEMMRKDGISARVIDIVTIKPLDEELVLDSAKKTGCVVTAENANVEGGLGGAIAECLAQKYPTPVVPVGIKDQFGCVGSESFLREKYGLTPENIVLSVKRAMKMKNGRS